MRLGIGSYTYVWSVGVPGFPQAERPMTALDLLDQATALGVRIVQIADNLPLDRLSSDELRALSRRAAELDIALEPGTSGIAPEHLHRYVQLASRLGSPILRVVIDTPNHTPGPAEVVSTLREVLPEFERAGVILAIENHDRFESAVLLDILQQAGSSHLGICFDTANSIGCLESAERVLETLGPHIVNVHVKDYALFRPPHHKGFVVEGRPAGQGDLNVPRLIGRLREFGRDPNVIIELWPPPQPTLHESIELERAWAQESVQYLRRFITE